MRLGNQTKIWPPLITFETRSINVIVGTENVCFYHTDTFIIIETLSACHTPREKKQTIFISTQELTYFDTSHSK